MVINLDKGTVLAKKLYIADNFFYRLKGLIGTADLENDTGLLIIPCSSIHTFFMRYSIDVVFLDHQNRVCRILHSLPPYRIGPIVKGAKKVLELNAGVSLATGTEIGDHIVFSGEDGKNGEIFKNT